MHQRQLDSKQEDRKLIPPRRAPNGSLAADLEIGPRPGLPTPGQFLLSLQSRRGNRYVQRVVNAARQGSPALLIQAKLLLGPAHDEYEGEADQVEKQVIRNLQEGVRRQTERNEEKDKLQAKVVPAGLAQRSIVQRTEWKYWRNEERWHYKETGKPAPPGKDFPPQHPTEHRPWRNNEIWDDSPAVVPAAGAVSAVALVAGTFPAVNIGPVYAKPYSKLEMKAILDDSEGRPSPVNQQIGHPRQHVGLWKKAIEVAEFQAKTKSVYINTDVQDKAISSGLNSFLGQDLLKKLDVEARTPTRAKLLEIDTVAAEVKVADPKIKTGHDEPTSWSYKSGSAERATIIVDSMGTGSPGDIHIQTAYPVLD